MKADLLPELKQAILALEEALKVQDEGDT